MTSRSEQVDSRYNHWWMRSFLWNSLTNFWSPVSSYLCNSNQLVTCGTITTSHRISHGFIIWIFISGALNTEHTCGLCSTAPLSCAGCISWKCVCGLREALEPTQPHFSSPRYLITTDAEKLHSGRRFYPVHRSSQSTMVMIIEQNADHINKRKGTADAAEMIWNNKCTSFTIITFKLSAVVEYQEVIYLKAQNSIFLPSSA